MKAFAWTSLVNTILFPLQLISLGLDTHQLYETAKDKKEVLAQLKLTDLTSSCEYVLKNHERLTGVFALSKKTKIDHKAQELLERLHAADNKETAKTDAEEFIKILRRRMHTKYNLEVAGIIMKVALVTLGALSLFILPNPVTLGIAGVFGAAGLVLFAAQKLVLNKDPFAKPSTVWYAQVAHKLRQSLNAITDAAERLSLRCHQATSALFVKKHMQTEAMAS